MIDPLFGGLILLWLISRSNLTTQDGNWETKKWVPLGWSEYQLQFEVNGLSRTMYMDCLKVKTFKEVDGVKELVSTSIGGYRLWITGEGMNRRYPNPNGQWGTMFYAWNPSWIFTSFNEASTAASNCVTQTTETGTETGDPYIPPVAPSEPEPLPPPPVAPPSGEPVPSTPTAPTIPTTPFTPNDLLLTNNGINPLNGQDLSSIGGYSR